MGERFAAVIWGTAEVPQFPPELGQKFGSWVDNWDDFFASTTTGLIAFDRPFESSSPGCDEEWMGTVALRLQDDPVCWTMLELQPQISHARSAWDALRKHTAENLDGFGLPLGELLIISDHT
jgi:hypothetical protein